MGGQAATLVIISAFLHALWNLLARARRSEGVFFSRALVCLTAVGAIPAAVAEYTTGPFPMEVYIAAAVSGVACGVYYFGLASAYELSDFTVVYPVARALPVVLVGLGDVLLGRHPNMLGWAGMLLVVGGCLMAPLHSLGEFRLRRYLDRAMLWMILAALGTVGYTLIDKAASEVVRSGPLSAARYGYFFFLSSSACYWCLLKIFRRGRRSAGDVGWRLPAIGGAATYLAYWLVLWAYQLADRAGYVVAFRQFSIVLAVVTAFAVYRERGVSVRLTAAVIITAGLVVIGLWGSGVP